MLIRSQMNPQKSNVSLIIFFLSVNVKALFIKLRAFRLCTAPYLGYFLMKLTYKDRIEIYQITRHDFRLMNLLNGT